MDQIRETVSFLPNRHRCLLAHAGAGNEIHLHWLSEQACHWNKSSLSRSHARSIQMQQNMVRRPYVRSINKVCLVFECNLQSEKPTGRRLGFNLLQTLRYSLHGNFLVWELSGRKDRSSIKSIPWKSKKLENDQK